METWASAPRTSLIRVEACPLTLERFVEGTQIFPVQWPKGVVVRSKTMRVPKKAKWASMLPEMLQVNIRRHLVGMLP